MRLSEICLAFFPARLPGADDADRLFAIWSPPNSVDNNQYAAPYLDAQALQPCLPIGMREVFPLEPVPIEKDRGCFFKRNAMLAKIDFSLPEIPGKHIYVYTQFAFWTD